MDKINEPINISMSSNDTGSTNELVIDSIDNIGVTEHQEPAKPSGENIIDLASLKKQPNKPNIIVTRSERRQPVDTNSSTRKAVNISQIPTKEEPKEEIKDSIEADLLNLDDPNSMISNYINKQKAEMEEWIAEKKEEKEVIEISQEDLDIAELTGDYSDIEAAQKSKQQEKKKQEEEVVYDINAGWHWDKKDSEQKPEAKKEEPVEMTKPDKNIIIDDLDISGILDDNNKEEKESMEIENNTNVEDLIPELPEEAKVKEEVVEDIEEPVEEVAQIVDEKEEIKAETINIQAAKTEKKEEEHKVAPLEMDVITESGSFEVAPIEEEEVEAEAAKSEDRDKETLLHLQKLVTEKLKPVSKKLDISSFTILKKPVIDTKVINENNNTRISKWVLPAQKSVVFMNEFSGSELEKLREYSNASRSMDSLNRRFKLIYDHITSAKPATYEAWTKCTPFADVDHYFFSIYISSFKGANYLPSDCPNKDCKETFLTDDIDIMKMVKFDSEKAKAEFVKLYQSEATPTGKGLYCTEVVPLNDKIAVSFRDPSIASLIEVAGLDDKTLEKFSAIIEYVPYIASLYIIDQANSTLIPITYKMFADDNRKTVISKIAKFNSVLSTLSVDEFGIIKAYIKAISDKKTGISYIYPSVNCPKCGSMTNEIDTTAEELVFTRYQLGALTTISLS